MKYETAPQVRQRYGGISDMTLWRWIHDQALGFPSPRVWNRRRYWSTADLDAFDARMAAQAGDIAVGAEPAAA